MNEVLIRLIDKTCGRPNKPCNFIKSKISENNIDTSSLNSFCINTESDEFLENLFDNKYIFRFVEISYIESYIANCMVDDSLLCCDDLLNAHVKKTIGDIKGMMQDELVELPQEEIISKPCYLILYKGEEENDNILNVYTTVPKKILFFLNCIRNEEE